MQYRVIDVPISRDVLFSDTAAVDRAVATSTIDATEAAFSLRRRNRLKPFDTIVFRLSVDVDWSNHPEVTQAIIDGLSKRVGRNPENPQRALYSTNYKPCIVDVRTGHELTPSDNALREIKLIKEHELFDIVMNSDALFEHSRSTLFGLPSGRLSDYFFRTGNLQISQQFTTAAFFWSLGRIKDVDHIVSDTWSISTTAARFADLLKKYSQRDEVGWTYLSRYLPSSVEAIAEFRRTLGQLAEAKPSGERSAKLLFLCSFSSTGKLRDSVDALVAEFSELVVSEFISLFAADNEYQPLCSINPVLKELGLSGSDHGVLEPNIRIRDINAASYFPDYRSPEPERFLVGDAKDKEFFERYSGQGIFSVFRTGASGSYFSDSGADTKGRHHAFHVDAGNLIGSKPFAKRFGECMRGTTFGALDGILMVPSSNGNLLLDQFVATMSVGEPSIFRANSLGLEAPQQELVEFLKTGRGRTLYVLIPMSITGHSLQRFQVRLREIVGGPENICCDVHLILAVLRPPEQRKVDEITRFFFREDGDGTKGSLHITVIESLVMPNWQESQCPWFRELRSISRTLKAESLPAEIDHIFRARRRVLRNSSTGGLKGTEVFFVPFELSGLIFNSGSRFLDRAKMAVRLGSQRDQVRGIFSKQNLPDASEADLCCAVASSVQHWRERVRRTALNPVCIDASTISNNNGFNESKLRAALWRSLTPTELRYGARAGSDFVSMVGRIFQSQISDANFSKLELEALLAFGREVPRAQSSTIVDWDWRETKFLARHIN
ncbi:MAG: hypothetical protein AAGK02_01075 [Pseudomonadota bacterium]